MNELWNARRKKLEGEVRRAALALFEHTASNSFKLPLDQTRGVLFVVAGDREAIARWARDFSAG